MNNVLIFSSLTLTDEDIEEFQHSVETYAPDMMVYKHSPTPGLEKDEQSYTISRSGGNNFLAIIRDPDYYLLHDEEVIQRIGYQPHTFIPISFPNDIEDRSYELMRDVVGIFASRWPCTYDNDISGEERRIFHQNEILRRWKNGEAYY